MTGNTCVRPRAPFGRALAHAKCAFRPRRDEQQSITTSSDASILLRAYNFGYCSHVKSTPTLYGNVESANTYKITLFFSLTREKFHFRTIDIFAGESRREEFVRDMNRFGEIPVLEHEGERIVQSAVILSYLAESCQALVGETDRERREIMEWLIWDTQRLSGYMAVYRHRARPKSSSLASTIAVAHPDPAIDAFFLARIEQALSLLD